MFTIVNTLTKSFTSPSTCILGVNVWVDIAFNHEFHLDTKPRESPSTSRKHTSFVDRAYHLANKPKTFS